MKSSTFSIGALAAFVLVLAFGPAEDARSAADGGTVGTMVYPPFAPVTAAQITKKRDEQSARVGGTLNADKSTEFGHFWFESGLTKGNTRGLFLKGTDEKGKFQVVALSSIRSIEFPGTKAKKGLMVDVTMYPQLTPVQLAKGAPTLGKLQPVVLKLTVAASTRLCGCDTQAPGAKLAPKTIDMKVVGIKGFLDTYKETLPWWQTPSVYDSMKKMKKGA